MVDKLPEERGRGMTVDISVSKLCTPKYCITLNDVPGDPRYVANLMTGEPGGQVLNHFGTPVGCNSRPGTSSDWQAQDGYRGMQPCSEALLTRSS